MDQEWPVVPYGLTLDDRPNHPVRSWWPSENCQSQRGHKSSHSSPVTHHSATRIISFYQIRRLIKVTTTKSQQTLCHGSLSVNIAEVLIYHRNNNKPDGWTKGASASPSYLPPPPPPTNHPQAHQRRPIDRLPSGGVCGCVCRSPCNGGNLSGISATTGELHSSP